MRMIQIYRHIREVCLICLSCFICSVPAFASEMATPSNADEITENQPALESESSKAPASANPGTSKEDALILITEIQDEDKLLSLPVFTLPLRSSPSDNNMERIYQLALQYQTVSATAAKGTESWQETLSVAWDFSSIHQTAAGEYAAVGRIKLPPGYAFGSNVLRELKIPVRVEEQAPAVITSIEKWHPYTDAFALQQGSSMEELERAFSLSPYHLECYAENGNSYTAVVEWDFSGVDLNTVGLYYAVGKLNAPDNTVFAAEILFPEILIPISVQAPGRPDINCLLVARGSLYFPWVMPPENLDKISVWISENNGPWNRLEDEVYVSPEMLFLSTHRLISGSSYRLQVDYDGEQTGILSFVYADELILEGYHEGDRDGGDAGGNPPDTVIQPPPEHSGQQNDDFTHEPSTQPSKPPAASNGGTDSDVSEEIPPNTPAEYEPSLKPSNPYLNGKDDARKALEPDSGSDKQAAPEIEAPVSSGHSVESAASPQRIMTAPTESVNSQNPVFSEFFDETTDRISGMRFLMMLQIGNQRAVFSKQGITVSIPKDALPDNIQNEDQIEVMIHAEPDGGFSFLFSINGTPLDSMPDISVILLYPNKAAAGTLYLCDENGVKIPTTGYDDTAKAASFQISHTGSYTIAAEDSAVSLAQATDTKYNQLPMLFLISACLLLLSIGVFFLRRR